MHDVSMSLLELCGVIPSILGLSSIQRPDAPEKFSRSLVYVHSPIFRNSADNVFLPKFAGVPCAKLLVDIISNINV